MEPLILIVDGEPHLTQVMRRALLAAGYAVDTARDGDEALGKIAIAAPDVLITDVRVSAGDGRSLYESVERNYPRRIGLAVLVGASASPAMRLSRGGRPRTEMFEKPVSQRRLVAHLQRHFAALERFE